MLRPSGWIAILLPLLASACDADSVVEVGVIDYYGESEGVIEAPRTVAAGERFVVTANTYGAGCNWAESMSIDRDEGSVELVPYDREDVAHPCTLQLVRIPHTAELEFSGAGPKTLIVHGRRVDQQNDTLITLIHQIMVQ